MCCLVRECYSWVIVPADTRRKSKEEPMPIVRVELWTGRTRQQKQDLAKAITDAVVKIAGTSPEATIVIFEDIDKENGAQGGQLAADL